jgi:hypothetical protein
LPTLGSPTMPQEMAMSARRLLEKSQVISW